MQSRADGSGLSSGDLDLKLDLLQQRFLEFASQRHNFSQHLKQVLDQLWSRNIDSGKYSGKGPMTNGRGTTEDVAAQINTFLGQDLATVTRDVAKTDDDSEKEILTQRQGVIQRRMDQLDKIAKAVSNIDKQMQLLEDTFGLIGDETHAQAPETIVTDVEEAVARSDALTKTIAELRPLQLAQ
jgi:flavodoxin